MDYKALYRAAFDFHARWMRPPTTIEEWERCAVDICDVANAHGNNPFLNDLLTAIYSEIERRYNDERKVNP